MDKEFKQKLKKIKVLYYPYKALKKIVFGVANYAHYIQSLRYIKENKERVQKKIVNKEVLNVVFVVQYIPGWNKLEPIYTKMLKDNRFNPIIVCVPLNIQNHQLMDDKGNDTYQYMAEHGYEAIDALQEDGGWFDLKNLAPDYLFHSRPYNHFMPEPYTSGEIVKYALICNVIYGTCMTKNELNVELNKDYFKDVYIYFSFDTSEKSFYDYRFKMGKRFGIQKCLPFGAIGIEQILNAKQDKNKLNFRKTVLWTPRWSTDPNVGGSNFFNYKDTLLQLSHDYQDILFIFRPHPLMFSNFIKTKEMTEEEVHLFKIKCKNESNIILDESKEYADTFWSSDILITDISGIIPEYFITQKPIVFCHNNANIEYVKFVRELITSTYEANNSNDIKIIFDKLIEDIDDKVNDRLIFIKKYLGAVQYNSLNILEALIALG